MPGFGDENLSMGRFQTRNSPLDILPAIRSPQAQREPRKVTAMASQTPIPSQLIDVDKQLEPKHLRLEIALTLPGILR